MPAYLSGPAHAKLDEQHRKLVELIVDHGLPNSVACREVGFSSAAPAKSEAVQAAIAERRARHEKLFDVTRRKVVDGMMEAVELAKTMAEPMVMVAGWREIGRLCGHYAPTQHKIDVNVQGNVTVRQIQQMSDEELVKLASEAPALEGEYEKVPHDESESSTV